MWRVVWRGVAWLSIAEDGLFTDIAKQGGKSILK